MNTNMRGKLFMMVIAARGVIKSSVLINKERVRTPSILKRLLIFYKTQGEPFPQVPTHPILAKKKAKKKG